MVSNNNSCSNNDNIITLVSYFNCFIGKYVDFCKKFALAYLNQNDNTSSNLETVQSTPQSQSEIETQIESESIITSTPETKAKVQLNDTSDNKIASSPSQSLPQETLNSNPFETSPTIVSSTPSKIYFQSWHVKMVDIKIDYVPDQVTLILIF